MRSLAEELALLPDEEQAEFIASLSEGEAAVLLHDWNGFLARPDQKMPTTDWDIWLILSGRGWGKTRTGAETVRDLVLNHGYRRIALVGETAADGRDVMVEGDSGLLAVHAPHERPLYQPSKRRVTWPNGAVATLFNATEPDQLRGPQFDLAWADEVAKWHYARETWDQLQFGLRLGNHPRVIATTTPRPIELVKALVAQAEGKCHVTRGSTMDNAANLADSFMRKIMARYGGTRLGRQELDGEILGDIPNALWSQSDIDAHRLLARLTDDGPVFDLPEFDQIIVSIDPATTDGDEANLHGIVAVGAAGKGENRAGYVLRDATCTGGPRDWAKQAVSLYHELSADVIVAETNQGGDMVVETIRAVDATVPVRKVTASRGKHVRAAPIAALYAQGRVRHVGRFAELEQQMTLMTDSGYQGEGSPDRCDALVWAMKALFSSIVTKKEPPKVRPVPPVRPMARGYRYA